MFRFFFGKSSRDTSSTPVSVRSARQAVVAPAQPAEAEIPLETQLAALANLSDDAPGIVSTALASGPSALRLAALARVHDEVLLLRIACEAKAAETRHAAALRVHTEAHLHIIAEQSRTRDKRVYKLARERLEAFTYERDRLVAQARCLEAIEELAAQTQPELSRVVDVERDWAALTPDAAANACFLHARARIHAQFQAQAEARRHALRGQDATPETTAPIDEIAIAALGQQQEISIEVAAAPRNGEEDGVSAHGRPVQEDEEAPQLIAEGDAAGSQSKKDGDGATRRPRKSVVADPALRDNIAAELAELETALDEGRLHDAETRLTALSALQSRAGGVAGPLGSRIRGAAEEIARLRAWRRWGGQQARDHLCEAAEALPARALPPEELSRAIKALRAQWQHIVRDEGGAPQHLWERFDAACERAWEPVRAHFAEQAERRSANLARREALLLELEKAATALAEQPVDWKALAQLSAESARRWRTLGPVDRKAMRQVDQRYQAAHGALEHAVRAVRDTEAAARDALIVRAQQLAAKPEARDSVTRMRELQAEWQTRARAIPLDRAREQALWERFRGVCNTFFEQRDAARAAEVTERSAQADAESAAFRARSEAWRAVCEAFSASVAVERALLAEPRCTQEEAQHLQTTFETAWSALPDMDSRQGRVLRTRKEGVLADLASPEARSDLGQRYTTAVQQLLPRVLELEIGLGLPSPEAVQAERRQMQLKKLAESLRSGGRDALEQYGQPVLDLLAGPCPDRALAQRIEQILLRCAPVQVARRAAPSGAVGAPRRVPQDTRLRRAE